MQIKGKIKTTSAQNAGLDTVSVQLSSHTTRWCCYIAPLSTPRSSCSGEITLLFSHFCTGELQCLSWYIIQWERVSCPWCKQLSVALRDTTPQCVHSVFLSHLFIVSVHLVWNMSFVTYSKKNIILLTVLHSLIHPWSLMKVKTCQFFLVEQTKGILSCTKLNISG